jgi:DNA-directed RNA polymerase III subunit RPC1
VKGRVEKTTLGEICKYIHVVLTPGACYVEAGAHTRPLFSST